MRQGARLLEAVTRLAELMCSCQPATSVMLGHPHAVCCATHTRTQLMFSDALPRCCSLDFFKSPVQKMVPCGNLFEVGGAAAQQRSRSTTWVALEAVLAGCFTSMHAQACAFPAPAKCCCQEELALLVFRVPVGRLCPKMLILQRPLPAPTHSLLP